MIDCFTHNLHLCTDGFRDIEHWMYAACIIVSSYSLIGTHDAGFMDL